MKMSVLNELRDFFNNNDKKFSDVPADTIVKWAEQCEISKDPSKSTTTTQLRRFYDAIKSIWDVPDKKKLKNGNLKEEYLARLIFLKPAFVGAANKKKINSEFKDIMVYVIDRVKSKEDFYKFVKFYEAIVQYSKK